AHQRRGAALGVGELAVRLRRGLRRRDHRPSAAAGREREQDEERQCLQCLSALLRASKLSIGSSRSAVVSLNESLSGQTRFAALNTSPASRATDSPRSSTGRAFWIVPCASSPVLRSCCAASSIDSMAVPALLVSSGTATSRLAMARSADFRVV